MKNILLLAGLSAVVCATSATAAPEIPGFHNDNSPVNAFPVPPPPPGGGHGGGYPGGGNFPPPPPPGSGHGGGYPGGGYPDGGHHGGGYPDGGHHGGGYPDGGHHGGGYPGGGYPGGGYPPPPPPVQPIPTQNGYQIFVNDLQRDDNLVISYFNARQPQYACPMLGNLLYKTYNYIVTNNLSREQQQYLQSVYANMQSQYNMNNCDSYR